MQVTPGLTNWMPASKQCDLYPDYQAVPEEVSPTTSILQTVSDLRADRADPAAAPHVPPTRGGPARPGEGCPAPAPPPGPQALLYRGCTLLYRTLAASLSPCWRKSLCARGSETGRLAGPGTSRRCSRRGRKRRTAQRRPNPAIQAGSLLPRGSTGNIATKKYFSIIRGKKLVVIINQII